MTHYKSPQLIALLALHSLANAQCKSTIETTDKIGDIKTALSCWERSNSEMRAELKVVKADLARQIHETANLQRQVRQASLASSEKASASDKRDPEVDRLVTENRRLRAQLSEKPSPSKPEAPSPPQFRVGRQREFKSSADCVHSARQALSAIGVDDVTVFNGQIAVAKNNAYRFQIMCLFGPEGVQIAVAGPNLNQVNTYWGEIDAHLKRDKGE